VIELLRIFASVRNLFLLKVSKKYNCINTENEGTETFFIFNCNLIFYRICSVFGAGTVS